MHLSTSVKDAFSLQSTFLSFVSCSAHDSVSQLTQMMMVKVMMKAADVYSVLVSSSHCSKHLPTWF